VIKVLDWQSSDDVRHLRLHCFNATGLSGSAVCSVRTEREPWNDCNTDTALLAHGDVVYGRVNINPHPPACYDVLCNMDALTESVIGGGIAVYM